jgi:hypothetical protein
VRTAAKSSKVKHFWRFVSHGNVFVLGGHRVMCGDCTDANVVARLLGDAKPLPLIKDPHYRIELDSEWRDQAA